MRAIAVIAAAGSGERLGAQRPKALVVYGGRPLLEWCLAAALAANSVIAAVVAAHDDELAEFERIAEAAGEAAGKPVAVVPGGSSRSHSVRQAVRAAREMGVEYEALAVHDAARPLAPPELFDACVGALGDADCVVAAVPVVDTIKVADADGLVQSTPDRAALWAVQTPQAFRVATLERALDVSDVQLAAATDDASLAEAIGARVRLLRWDRANPKVTTIDDLQSAQTAATRPPRNRTV